MHREILFASSQIYVNNTFPVGYVAYEDKTLKKDKKVNFLVIFGRSRLQSNSIKYNIKCYIVRYDNKSNNNNNNVKCMES